MMGQRSSCHLLEVYHLPFHEDQEDPVNTIKRGVIPSNNAIHSERFLMRNTDQGKCSFKRADHLALIRLSRGVGTIKFDILPLEEPFASSSEVIREFLGDCHYGEVVMFLPLLLRIP